MSSNAPPVITIPRRLASASRWYKSPAIAMTQTTAAKQYSKSPQNRAALTWDVRNLGVNCRRTTIAEISSTMLSEPKANSDTLLEFHAAVKATRHSTNIQPSVISWRRMIRFSIVLRLTIVVDAMWNDLCLSTSWRLFLLPRCISNNIGGKQ